MTVRIMVASMATGGRWRKKPRPIINSTPGRTAAGARSRPKASILALVSRRTRPRLRQLSICSPLVTALPLSAGFMLWTGSATSRKVSNSASMDGCARRLPLTASPGPFWSRRRTTKAMCDGAIRLAFPSGCRLPPRPGPTSAPGWRSTILPTRPIRRSSTSRLPVTHRNFSAASMSWIVSAMSKRAWSLASMDGCGLP